MPTHPNPIVDDHLKKLVGSNWTLSGSTVTLTSGVSIDPATRYTLQAGLEQQGLIEKVVAGVATYVPR